jgi:hypothetical protein
MRSYADHKPSLCSIKPCRRTHQSTISKPNPSCTRCDSLFRLFYFRKVYKSGQSSKTAGRYSHLVLNRDAVMG